jgi:hypothetical protein
VVRQLREASLQQAAINFSYSTVLPRYVMPLHFIVLGSAIAALLWAVQRAPRLCTVGLAGLALAAVTAQKDFRMTTFAYVEPLSRISHAGAWRLLLATVRECRIAQLPVPNVPLDALTRGFIKGDAQLFEPLIRRDLALGPEDKIEMIPWKEYLAGKREAYSRVPSLRLLEEKLNLPRN